ncbi:MAG: DUF29 domain-containing protein [Microcoleaceae cyanobacterium]
MKLNQSLYEKDFNLWTETHVNLLKAGKFSEIDLPNLIEEIDSMGKREKREIRSRLIVLLMHLLKWKYQPNKRSESWISTISEQRLSLEELLADSPSLQPFITEVFEVCYQKARVKATQETKMMLDVFPAISPFSLGETLDSAYFPE